MAGTLVDEGAIALLTKLKTEVYAGADVVLFTAPTSFSRATAYSDLTLANFSGYTNEGLTLSDVAINGDGKAEMTADQVTFAHDGGGTANTVYGYAIARTIDNKLFWIELFDDPKNMEEEGDVIKITPRFTTTDALLE